MYTLVRFVVQVILNISIHVMYVMNYLQLHNTHKEDDFMVCMETKKLR